MRAKIKKFGEFIGKSINKSISRSKHISRNIINKSRQRITMLSKPRPVDVSQLAKKYALQNAVKYSGKANPGAVIGKIFGEHPDLKETAKDLAKEVAKVVGEVNKLDFETQQKQLQEIAPELLEKKEAHHKDMFEFIGIREGQKIVTAFPPEPSKYPHIGHAKAIFVNYELARRYNGKFLLRFEDTNPELAEDEFYKIHLDNYEWLGIKPDAVEYASDYMEEFYKYAEKLIKEHHAYVCSCKHETIKKNRMEGKECPCRYTPMGKEVELWHKMFSSKVGKYVLRLKGHMQSQNTTLRDPVIFRAIDQPHPRTKEKYRIWPNYDFENAIMDGIEGVTHRLRTKEFELRNELQRLIQSMAGFRETQIYEFARFNLEGVESSGRIIREKVKKKELLGWDDPSLTTLVALRRRGFLPEAIKEFVLETGLTKNEAVLKWDDLIVHNRRLLDMKVDRYFFVDKPREIEIENAPEQDVELKLHPESRERGTRKFHTKDKFYVTEKDFKEFKEDKLYRLMDCLNFAKKKQSFFFDSTEYEKYKEKGDKIIHWLPADNELVKTEVLMPDGKTRKGLAETATANLKVGDIVQFTRFGFCKLDRKDKGKLYFWFTHE